MKHIGFKSYSWFFDQYIIGSKTWDARLVDLSDDRIYALRYTSTRDAGAKQEVETITFADFEGAGDRITFRYDRMEFVDWAPGWCFLVLGEQVETPADIYFGPSGPPQSPGIEARRQRAVMRAVVAVGRLVLPPLVDRMPARLQSRIKNGLPCVFAKPVVPPDRKKDRVL